MEKDKSRFIIWLLVVIIIILVTVAGVLLYKTVTENGTQIMEGTNNTNHEQVNEGDDKVENSVENNITNSIEKVSTNKYGISIPTDKDVHIYSYIDQQKVIKKGAAGDTNLTISLRIPQIKYDTEVTRNINSDILNKFEDYIKAFDENKYETKYDLADVYLTSNYAYIYTTSENRIYLNVSKGFGNSNASGFNEEYTYIYDISNDKQITFSELLTEKGITVEKIIQKLYENYDFKNSYGSNEEAKQWTKNALNNNFSNVTLEDIEVDKNFNNFRNITLKIYVYRDSYIVTLDF